MRRPLRRFILSACILLLCGGMSAQTLHIIGFFDTNDSRIGTSVTIDKQEMESFISDVVRTLSGVGYTTRTSYYTGASCSRASLVTAMDSLQVNSDDVVLFIYSGHGARAMNDADLFPQMCLGERLQENFVPVTRVKNILNSKGGRLNLIFTDCCNKQSSWVSSKPLTDIKSASYNYLSEACKKLFVETAGNVVMTSSKVGEYSYGNSSNGGIFTRAFINQWEKIKEGSVKPDWNSFCSAVQYECSLCSINLGMGQYTYQHPYFEIEQKSIRNSKGTTVSEKSQDQFIALSQAVGQLLDKKLDRNAKLKLAKEIKNKYFPAGAKIITMLEDRNTIIRYEDVSDFLERLALSSNISRVNFFQVENNKYSVYEYR